MNVETLKKSNLIIFECISGSHSYGTNVETSDLDIRGLYRLSKDDYMSLVKPIQEVSDNKQDIKYYELRKFIELAKDCNPNIVELFWTPEDCIRIKSPIMDKLIENRHLFIHQRAFHSFGSYAYSQISKCRGQNKLVNHPELAIIPKKEDFCWVIPSDGFNAHMIRNIGDGSIMPARPVPLKNLNSWNLSEMHCSALEHVSNTFRLYHYGKDAKGIFRGNDMLVCESIPFEDECSKFVGLLIYNQPEFEKAIKEHKRYKDWIENRNNARWVDQEKGLLNYDQKNIMHCVRLLLSGANILKNGEPIVRFEGEQLKYLKDIRAGKFEYEDIMARVEGLMAELDVLRDKCTLPIAHNMDKIDELYKELMDM
jgi:predicted nucleotidyltransferase